MNNNQQLDDHVKEQFRNYAPDVPPHIWDNIMAKRKKRPTGILFFMTNRRNLLIVLCTLLAGGSGAWLLNNSLSNNTSQKRTASLKSIINNNTSSNGQLQIVPEEKAVTTGNTEAATGNTTAIDQTKEYFTAPSAIKLTIYPFSQEKITAVNRTKQKKTNSVLLPGKNDIYINSEAATDYPDNETTYTGLPVGGTLLNRLLFAVPAKESKKENTLPLDKRNAPNVIIPDCPREKDIAGNKKYFELYGSVDYGLRSLKDTGNSTYLQQRKETAKFTSAYSGGVRYTRVFNNGMSVRGGINFSQINEKFSFVQGNVINIMYITNTNGDTTGSYITTGTRYKTTHNKYRSIDIPLMIGYEMGNGRLHTNINAGPVINLYSWQRGDILGPDGKPVSISTGKSNSPYGFKTNAGIGFMGAISFYYKLNDTYHLLAEPYFRYNFSQMNKETQTFQQKYNTIGLRLGIRLDIP